MAEIISILNAGARVAIVRNKVTEFVDKDLFSITSDGGDNVTIGNQMFSSYLTVPVSSVEFPSAVDGDELVEKVNSLIAIPQFIYQSGTGEFGIFATISAPALNDVLKWNGTNWVNGAPGGGGVTDGDKGDITVSGGGTVWTIDAGLPADRIADGSVSNTEFQYLNGVSSGIQTQLDGKVDENAPILGATKTKITFDAKGLVTGGADATTADISDSLNRRYVTDADLVDIGNLSGVNSGDQTSIVGISGTKAEFDSACSDGNFLFVGDIFQYTDEMAQDAVGGILSNSTEIEWNYDDASPFIQASLTVGSVALNKLVDIATSRILGRITAGAGEPEVLTGTQATTLLDLFTSVLKGLVPASGGGTTNFLRADGTWTAPAGGSGITQQQAEGYL